MAPRLDHEIERLLEARHPLVPWYAVRCEFLRDVPRCDAKHEAAVRKVVENGDVLGELQRRIQRNEENSRPDPHRLGDRRRGRERDERPRAEPVRLHVVRSGETELNPSSSATGRHSIMSR